MELNDLVYDKDSRAIIAGTIAGAVVGVIAGVQDRHGTYTAGTKRIAATVCGVISSVSESPNSLYAFVPSILFANVAFEFTYRVTQNFLYKPTSQR